MLAHVKCDRAGEWSGGLRVAQVHNTAGKSDIWPELPVFSQFFLMRFDLDMNQL